MKYIAPFSILLLFAQCSDTGVEPTAQEIIGSWNWIRTRPAFEPDLTPESTGYRQTLVLTVDGQAFFYRDGSLLYTKTIGIAENLLVEHSGYYLDAPNDCLDFTLNCFDQAILIQDEERLRLLDVYGYAMIDYEKQ